MRHTLTDENLRRRLLEETMQPPPRPRMPWYELAALTAAFGLMGALVSGLVIRMIFEL